MKRGSAVLARPDNIVAWRSLRHSREGGHELVDAFKVLPGGSKSELEPQATCFQQGAVGSTPEDVATICGEQAR